MNRILIVSNRLPYNISIDKKTDELLVIPSVGGLATGMKSVYENNESKWIGWPGIDPDEMGENTRQDIDKKLDEINCIPVYLTKEDIDNYYFGFSNKTIWPLFHYFTQYTKFEKKEWEAYKTVNEKFADEITKHLQKGDKLWIHDYHLLLLPGLIKERMPDVTIGFFLHIPFPSFEVFRILPWREEIIKGMLGADLLGFHTYDYERHFLSSVRRLLGYETNFNEIILENRTAVADSFPMGIDYERFEKAALESLHKSVKDKSKIRRELDKYMLVNPDVKLILSIDRLDYTKGIANRLYAFEYFLEKHPEFKEKVTLVMLSVPSRASVPEYKLMKSEVDELVGRINGKYSTINWMPVWYFYRSMPFENLVDLYTSSEIALLTPIRDGMNLVAKEYLACKVDNKGVLILSEMAGAAKEMSEAIIVNPHNYEEISDALKRALEMPHEEQISRNKILKKRLTRYNVDKWANDFVNSLLKTEIDREKYTAKKINQKIETNIIEKYSKAKKRILFLDYDGTLTGFRSSPEKAKPDSELYELLDKLADDEKTTVVLISGRDKDTFTKWFEGKNYSMITEHGIWHKSPDSDWRLIEDLQSGWKETIRPILDFYIDRTPGSFLEEKNFSLVWHYRNTDPELGKKRSHELKDELKSLTANHNLEIMEGNKVVEVKNSGINKGRAARMQLQNKSFDFILGIGDDWTDEYLFEDLPESAYTIKVGYSHTQAKYHVDSYIEVRKLLKKLQ